MLGSQSCLTAQWEQDLPNQMHGACHNFLASITLGCEVNFEISYFIPGIGSGLKTTLLLGMVLGFGLVFPWHWGLNPGPQTCQTDTQPHPIIKNGSGRDHKYKKIQEHNSKGSFCTLRFFPKQIVGVGLDFTTQMPLRAMICTWLLFFGEATRWWHLDLPGLL